MQISSTRRYALCALIALAALLTAASSPAQSPFDGTWKTDLSKTKFSPKPLTFYTSAGWYHCVSCSSRLRRPGRRAGSHGLRPVL